MIHPKKVGEGSYGCVHNPPLKCRNKPYNPDPTKVSKILTKKNANDELKEFKLIQKADKKEDFHLGKPDACFPDDNIDNQNGLQKNNKNQSKISFMIFRTGSILIVGKCEENIIYYIYNFIKKIINDEFELISKQENYIKKQNICKKNKRKNILFIEC